MTRPRRLYFDESLQKFYYIIKKKRVFIKVPKGVTQKQVQKVNIKNIVNLPETRRIKRRKKKVNPKFQKVPQKNLLSLLTRQNEGGLPYFIFKEQQQFPTLEELSKKKVIKPEPEFTAMKPEPSTPMKPEPKTSRGSRFNPISFDTQSLDSSRKKFLFKKITKNKIPPVEFGIPLTEPVAPMFSQSPFLTPTLPRVTRPKAPLTDIMNKALRDLQEQNRKKKGEQESKGDDVSGKGVSNDDGLYNDQIEKILKKRIKDYVPVIPADKTDDLLKYVAKGDKRFGAIINTADSKSDGTGQRGNSMGHWTAIFVNNEDDYPTMEFFDPLVSADIPNRLYNSLRKIARKMNPEMMFKFKPNMIQRQDINKSTCGYHSMKFIDDRYNGIPFSDASGYDNFIDEHKGANDSADGERDIDEYKKKFSSYI